ncbi:MAG: zinc ribbon domain-containing protein [Chloroflexi bacterium]|nr:zinc ribbon domain-containing protein [Chloroflexota bacterium]
MPIYEYRCQSCRRRVSIFLRSFSSTVEPVCNHCGSKDLTRLVSQVAVIKGWGSSLEGPDFGALNDADDSDPQAMAKWMKDYRKQMTGEEGELSDADMLDAGIPPDTEYQGPWADVEPG